jgi:S1-C subfamily serine protease
MSAIRNDGGRSQPVILALLASALFTLLPAWGGVYPADSDSLLRVRLKQRFSGVFHEDRLISQSTVVEVNEFHGVVWDDRGHVVSFIGSTWANLAGVRPGASLVLPDGSEAPAELVGVDERISLAVLRSPDLAGRSEPASGAELAKSSAFYYWTEDGWAGQPLRVVRATPGDFDAEQELRVRLGDPAPRGRLADEGVLLDTGGRFTGFVTASERGGVSPLMRSMRVIPVEAARESVREVLLRDGSVRAGWLGVFMEGGASQVRVQEVVENSPAARAGLRPGDRVVKVGETEVSSDRQFVKRIRWGGPGGRVDITVERDGALRTFSSQLGEWPVRDRPVLAWAVQVPRVWRAAGDSPEPQEIQLYRVPVGTAATLGLAVEPLTPQLARFFRSPTGRGLLVKTVLEGTPAGKFGLRAGDVLLRINNRELESADDMGKVVEASGDGVLAITFVRDGKLHSRRVVVH